MKKKKPKAKSMSQKQVATQIVQILLPTQPKRRRKRKAKPQSKTGAVRTKFTQPYQIPLYTPPFPVTMPRQRNDNTEALGQQLRNSIAINKAELHRLKGNVSAYRQEQISGRRVMFSDQTDYAADAGLEKPGPDGSGGGGPSLEQLAAVGEAEAAESKAAEEPPKRKKPRPRVMKTKEELIKEFKAPHNMLLGHTSKKIAEIREIALANGISIERDVPS